MTKERSELTTNIDEMAKKYSDKNWHLNCCGGDYCDGEPFHIDQITDAINFGYLQAQSEMEKEVNLFKSLYKDDESEIEKLQAQLKIAVELLDESLDWLCSHELTAIAMQKQGVRGWCSSCSNYLRSEKDTNLVERIKEALSKIQSANESEGEKK